MTPDEFRANPLKVQRLRELLADPVMEEALIVVKDYYPINDAADVTADAIASVRTLSQLVGFNQAINTLLALGVYLDEPPAPIKETWGVEEETPQEPKP